jgi:hypothetical protein
MFTIFKSLPSVRNTGLVFYRSSNLFRYCYPIVGQLSQRISPNFDVPDVGLNNTYHPTTTYVRNFKSVSWRKRSLAIKKRLKQAEQRYRKPGQLQAVSMPLSPQEMDNAMLVVLSQMGKRMIC